MEPKADIFDIQTVSKHRLHLICSTVCLIAFNTYWMYGFLSDTEQTDDSGFLVSMMVLGFLGIWTLIAGLLLQVAMSIKTSTVVITAFVALFAPYVTGIFLITQSSIKLIHARRDN